MTPRSILLAVAICIALVVIVQRVRAQAHVESNAYDVMLSTLLAHSVPEIDVKQAVADSTAVRLDAREQAEFSVSHLPNATWVGYDDFNLERVAHVPKDTPIIVYCSVGYRSEKIAEKLRKAGYTNVSNLYGGIFEWVNTEHEVVDTTGSATAKVHAYSKSWGVWLTRGEKVYQ